ncbi:MAG: hypothetical protein ACUVQP_00110 [Bacteroidales bacterium]
MLTSKLAERVREELNEGNTGVFFTDADIYDSLMDGYTTICMYTGLLNKQYNLPIVANQVYYDLSHLSDYLRIVAVYNPNTNKFLTAITYTVLNKSLLQWELTAGTPQFYCPFPVNMIAFYPHYAVKPQHDLTIYYKAWESNFYSQGDIDLPDAAEDCLINYVVSDLYDQILEIEKSKIRWTKFINELNEIKRIVQQPARAGQVYFMKEI